MKKCTWFILLILTIVSACATPTSTPASSVADVEAVLTSPLSQPASPVSVPPTPQLALKVPDEFAELKIEVATQLQIVPEDLSLILIEEITWRDTSLGCPKIGMKYAQVLVPGWRFVFEDASGQQHPVHTGGDIAQFVICPQSVSENAGGDANISSGINEAKQAAVNAMMKRLEVSREAVSVTSVESVDWRNSCLGCEAAGQMCLEVITPGYRIHLEVDGKAYAVHTDSTGKQAIVCDKFSDPPQLPNTND